jgi:hydrogen peroxide-dependent heme synthase
MHNPQVPETLEGWSLGHHMYRIRWEELKSVAPIERKAFAEEASKSILPQSAETGYTAFVHMLGHKAELMLIHFRQNFEQLSQMELSFSQTRLHDFLEPTTSYVSIVELGMYDMTAKIHSQLGDRGLKPGSEAFDEAFNQEMEQQRKRMMNRLFPEIPKRRHVCFYPMNKRRGETKNWYMEPFDDRSEMMLEHGMIGRNYAGRVTQIISGSIGLDDWEWGVDLFADDPLVFKKLIYEMRFDRASAVYAEFGQFYVGLQFASGNLGDLLQGRTPPLLSNS